MLIFCDNWPNMDQLIITVTSVREVVNLLCIREWQQITILRLKCWSSFYSDKLIMGIDLATWRARIGLNYYQMCRPLQTRWRSCGGWLYQPGVASWGVGEVMSDTPLVLKGCMTVVALSLILQCVVHSWSQLKGKCGGGKVHCHWQGSVCLVRSIVDGGGTLLLRAIVVVMLLLVIAGDVETNPGPEGNFFFC